MSEEIIDRAAEAASPSPAPEIPAAPVIPAAPEQYQAAPTVAPRRERRGGIGFGVLLVFIGLGLLANQFVPGIDLWRYWPVAIIVLGIVSVIRGLVD